MNHHIPAAVTEGLRRRGVDVVTAFEDGAARWDDEELLARATELGRTLFSQDEDLLAVTHNWLKTGKNFSGLVYAHQQQITLGQAVKDLELIAKALEPHDMRNRIEFIPF
jgi:predicted nuclease of predicted toxin-antitoxin system